MCIEYSLKKTHVNSPKGPKVHTSRLPEKELNLDSLPKEQSEVPSVWARLWSSVWGSATENDSTPHLLSYARNWVKFGVPWAASNDLEKLQLKCLGLFFVMCAAFYMVFPETAYWCLNPFDFSVPVWLALFQGKQWALQAANLGVLSILEKNDFPRLAYQETETGAEIVKARHLKPLDYFFFRVNALFDMVFLSHLIFYVLTDPQVTGIWDYSFFGVLQYIALSLATFPVVLILTDVYYSFLHWVMHKEPFYSWIHQIHHEIIIPGDGLVDVRSYSPVEIFLSSFTILFGLLAVPGVTRLTAFLSFHSNVASNIMNHSGYDVKLRMFGRNLFHTGNHEMHHRFPKTNMGIISMLADIYLLDVYVPYKED